MSKKKVKKANARSQSEPTRLELERWRKDALRAAERILPFDERLELDNPTRTRLSKNVTAALAFFPPELHKIKTVEELNELGAVLAKDAGASETSETRREAIREEIADCYIVLAKVSRLYFEGKADFNGVVNRKLNKLEARVASARSLFTA